MGLMSVGGGSSKSEYAYVSTNNSTAYFNIICAYVDAKGVITTKEYQVNSIRLGGGSVSFHGLSLRADSTNNLSIYAEVDLRVAGTSGWTDVKSGGLVSEINRGSVTSMKTVSVSYK